MLLLSGGGLRETEALTAYMRDCRKGQMILPIIGKIFHQIPASGGYTVNKILPIWLPSSISRCASAAFSS
ncbi:MAG TPA: hypothetical protein VKA94_13025, partial [Hyphomicrobiales bacterium]|nr:hypothetical protein [Hyphomicrobiales bacterium]